MLAPIISQDTSRASALFRDEQLKEREEQEYFTTNGRLRLLADQDLQLCMNLSYSNTHNADNSIRADCRRRSTLNVMISWLMLTSVHILVYRPLAHEVFTTVEIRRRQGLNTDESMEYQFGSEISTTPPDSDIVSQSYMYYYIPTCCSFMDYRNDRQCGIKDLRI
jgi:hypothetical protein